jgi:GNAT superfamily N-acetyltransferase
VPGLIGLRAVSAPGPFRNLVLLEGETPVACIRTGLPFVAPEHRGRGLGALLVLISDINGGRFLCPVSYSEAGYRARRAAHALQVRIMSGPAYQDGSGELVISMHR